MRFEFEDELIIEGVARAAERILCSEQFIDRIADAIALRFELIEPDVAAAILKVTPPTLRDNHIGWGLDKSVAFGLTNPRYFLSQIIERARAKAIKGSKRKPELQEAA